MDVDKKAPGMSQLTVHQLEARRLAAFEMHTVKRMTYAQIGERLGVSDQIVMRDIRKVLNEKHEKAREIANNVKAKQNTIYEALINKWLPVALGDLPQGERDEEYSVEDRIALIQAGALATDKIATVMRDQAKLHGFHQPKPPDPKETGKGLALGMYETMQKLAGGRTVLPAIEVKQIEDEKPEEEKTPEPD